MGLSFHLAWLLAAVAPESAAELELTWSAPPPCPDGDEVLVRIEQLLRRPLGPAGELGMLRVRARIDETDPGYRLELAIGADAGERTRAFEGPSCDTLAETVALLTAISLDPAVDPLGEPEPKPEPKPEPQPEPRPTTEPEPVPAPRPQSSPDPGPGPEPEPDPRFRGALFIGGSGAAGLSPVLAPGVTGAVSLLFARSRVQARVDHWLARTIDASGPSDAAGRISMTTAGVRGCVTPVVDAFDFPVCAGLTAGAMRGEGVDISDEQSARLPFVALDVGPAVGFAPRRLRGALAFVLGVDLVVPLTRPGFFLDDGPQINRVFPVVGRLNAGLELRLPRLAPSAKRKARFE